MTCRDMLFDAENHEEKVWTTKNWLRGLKTSREISTIFDQT